MNTTSYHCWKSKESQALHGSDIKKIEQQVNAGKKTARQRLVLLLDDQSFEEVGQLVSSPHLKEKLYTDGVITGFGTINGKKVAVYAQDFTIKGGSLGKEHANKICKIMDMAVKIGCPIIGLFDSGGARIDEGIHALAGYSDIFMRNVRYSGVIPQLSLIMGPCAGGAAYSPALTDFVFMTREISQMFVTGPSVIKEALGETIDKNDLGGTHIHGKLSGVAHVITDSEEETFSKVKELLHLLPSNYLETSSEPTITEDDMKPIELETLIPEAYNLSYNMKEIITSLVDHNSFFEIHADFAPNMVVGFALLGNKTVGLVANQPSHMAGTIDIKASIKGARFINFCNSFDIPIVSLVDVPGYLPGVDQERNGIIREGAKLLFAYANATVPKITVILRKAFGGAYIVMGSKGLGADFNFAWPGAQIAVLGANSAVTILHGRALAQAPDEQTRTNLRNTYEADYTEQFLHPYIAAEHGYIDAIIEPSKTRYHILKALAITHDKVERIAQKKQPNSPL